uniref:uncharacterized protein LOC120327270 isoform X1 n=1 Tax=Styela clava TaxID=7725 RepID=UPI00193A3C91|nr:uncharacterized protein LOC120327270 isoform X1 [Styela clava]
MSGQNTILTALDEAFQLHESETVIELGPDRILQFIGVRLVIILAIAVKLTELIVGNITCHPVKNETGYSSDFIKYCETYCWESPVIKYVQDNNIQNLCKNNFNVNDGELLKQPNEAINVMRWMPYAMLFQAFLLSLPSAWWHLRVGGRLMGHLKFMKLFIERMYEKVKDVPAGVYHSREYYDGSLHVNGWEHSSRHQDGEVVLVNNDTPGIRDEVNELLGKVRGHTLTRENDKEINHEDPENETTKSINSTQGITQSDESKMLDRHLFSMLCYENFSSLECYPYLLSIFRLTFLKHFEDQEGVYPMDDAILHQWCHKENFSSRFLVIRYYLKHVFSIIISLAIIRATAFVFEILGSDIWESENFLCNVLYYENEHIVCTLHRKTEMLAFLVINFIIITIYLIISSSHLYFTSRSRNRQTSLFFEHIKNRGSLVMLAALREMQDKEKNNS